MGGNTGDPLNQLVTPLERQQAALPLMSPEDFGMLFSNYLEAHRMNKRATKHELYRSWVGL